MFCFGLVHFVGLSGFKSNIFSYLSWWANDYVTQNYPNVLIVFVGHMHLSTCFVFVLCFVLVFFLLHFWRITQMNKCINEGFMFLNSQLRQQISSSLKKDCKTTVYLSIYLSIYLFIYLFMYKINITMSKLK